MTFWKTDSWKSVGRSLAGHLAGRRGAGLRPASTSLLRRLGSGPAAIEIHDDGELRWMRFGDGAIQSRISLDDPDTLSLPYTVGMAAPLLFRERFRRVLMVGLGGGSLLRYYHHLLPRCHFTVVELSSLMVDVSRRYFDAPVDDERVTVEIGDAREVLPELRTDYDLVMLDIFDEDGLPDWVLQGRFAQACRSRVARGGMLLANLWISRFTDRHEATAHLRSGFDGGSLAFTPADSTNLLVLAFESLETPLDVGEATARARRLRADTRIDTVDLLDRICASNSFRDGVLGG